MPGRRGENAKRQWQAQTGVILPLLAVGMAVLLAMAGLAVDGGQAYVLRNRVQNAADAAALSAAQELKLGNGAGAAETAARATATANGFTQGVSNTTVSVSIPPGVSPGGVTRSFAANPGFARVTISRSVATGLLRAVGRNTLTPSASAVAGISPDPLPCILVKPSPSTGTGLTLGGGGTLVATNCTVAVASTGLAISQSGSGRVTAGSVWVGTGASWSGTITPTPNRAVLTADQFNDPFTRIPAPAIAANCTAASISATTLSAGTYGRGGNGTTCDSSGLTNIRHRVQFNPGTYVLNNVALDVGNGGELVVSSNPGDGSGGVMFYITGTSSVNIGSQGEVHIRAPSSGTYRGMLFWQTNVNTFNISAGSELDMLGNMYFPNNTLSLGGGATVKLGAILAKTITQSGNSTIEVYNNFITNYMNAGPPLLFE